ncbi:DUF192 domain-containing protein [Candidatus Daviesbacteria bacterium]|nr:DUF192 domain-containing protein [Candidatus Daviesbacteria bacterium]
MDKKFAIQIIGLVILIFAGFLITKNPTVVNNALAPLGGPNQPVNMVKLKVKDAVVNAEIADTQAKRAKGLSGRDSLASDSGMLFLYEKPGNYIFWMKGMKFSLDFIWIKGDSVVDLTENVSPPQPGQTDAQLTRYQASEPIDKILEVNSGFVKQKGININDKLSVVK